jgi:hypothetical protein
MLFLERLESDVVVRGRRRMELSKRELVSGSEKRCCESETFFLASAAGWSAEA